MSLADDLRRLSRRLSGQRVSAEEERLVELFRNRAELKKELSDLDDERHRLLDRLKLQEGATMRVNFKSSAWSVASCLIETWLKYDSTIGGQCWAFAAATTKKKQNTTASGDIGFMVRLRFGA